jgi:hypothetical protein
VLTIAGLWDEWKNRDTGERLKSCAMIITTPNKFVAEVHDRMPVLLKPEQFEHWLSGDMGVKELKPIDNGYASRTRGDEPAIHSAGAFSWMRPRRRGDEPIASTRSEVPPVASPHARGKCASLRRSAGYKMVKCRNEQIGNRLLPFAKPDQEARRWFGHMAVTRNA